MLANFHGNGIELAELRSRLNVGMTGATLATLLPAAETLGLSSRAVRLDMDELGKLRLPCMVHVGLNHFVVLTAISKRHVSVQDPATGPRRLSLQEFSQTFTGVAVEVQPTRSFAPTPRAPKLSIRHLVFGANGVKGALSSILAISLLLELVVLASPLLTQAVVDHVIIEGDADLLLIVAVGMTCLLLVQTIAQGIRAWCATAISLSLNLEWSSRVFAHLVKLPQQYFERRQLGDIVSRFDSLDAIQQSVANKSVEIVIDAGMAALSLSLMIYYSWQLAIVTAAAIVAAFISRMYLYRGMRDTNANIIGLSAQKQGVFLETVRGQTEVKLHNGVAFMVARYINRTVRLNNASAKFQSLNIVFSGVDSAIFGLHKMVVLCLGASLAIRGLFTAGMLIAFIAYADQFCGRVISFFDFALHVRMLRVHAERVADIALATEERWQQGRGTHVEPDSSIELRNVSFRYSDTAPWVLKSCSLKVEAGEVIAIVGASGSGKSTLLKIMCGLLDPLEGAVALGNVELSQLGKHAQRSITSVVMQECTLFSGTIGENISFFDPSQDQDAIDMAARRAGILDDILRMPMRFHTRVGDMGAALSGGQRQRVALARALYRNPKILLLDEATSHLDIDRERQIAEEIRQMRLTKIIVSHRPETIKDADRVFVLDQGTLRPVTTHRAGAIA
jgi:ATP-binding cassette subfamily B protein RaxB